MPARPLLLEPLVRRLLTHDDPTVVDGKTDGRHWLPDPAHTGGLRKVDFYQRAFGHLDLACYDPVFDLAGAAADPPSPQFEAQLRGAYERMSGRQIDGERWLLYRLAQLWRLGSANDLDRGHVRQRSESAVHDYLAALYLRDLPPATGPLCAIDLDGVLECDRLGYPATSPTGMLAIRALIAHGYQPALATGRSLPDVRDRCVAFGLAGGVAEYGTAIYHNGELIDLRPPATRALLDRIRHELSGHPGVQVDLRHRYAVRARTNAGPLRAELISDIPALADPAVRMVARQGPDRHHRRRHRQGVRAAGPRRPPVRIRVRVRHRRRAARSPATCQRSTGPGTTQRAIRDQQQRHPADEAGLSGRSVGRVL